MTRGLDFPTQCRLACLPEPVPEYRFHATRRWRLDWAWPDQRLAVEQEGGIFIRGRHTRGVGVLKDFEKYNALAVMGWRLLRFSPQQIRNGEAFWVVQAALATAPETALKPSTMAQEPRTARKARRTTAVA